jgi:capsular exopolysaccharide synthesis family protein
MFTSRLAETRGQADRGILQPDASIITTRGCPALPSYPKPKLYFASTLVLAIGAGLLFITPRETLRRGFCSGDEIERKLECRGLLAAARSGPWMVATRLRQEVRPTAAGAVSCCTPIGPNRQIDRWLGNCLFANGDQSRVVLLTSAKAGEGKTTAAVALARYLTQANCATVVIEADLCRPQLDKTFRIPASPGLRDLLRGTSSLDAVLYRDDASGVYTIPAGAVDLELHDALPWQAIEPLLASIRQRFDLVIIDGPPVLQAPEAGLLSRLSDATIFVVQWARTDRRMVTTGLDQIAQSGGRIGGMLLTMVNTRKYARYGINDSHRFLLEGGRRSLV